MQNDNRNFKKECGECQRVKFEETKRYEHNENTQKGMGTSTSKLRTILGDMDLKKHTKHKSFMWQIDKKKLVENKRMMFNFHVIKKEI